MEINVRHIAELAMLKLPEEQVGAMEQEFAAFIAMAERLPPLETLETLENTEMCREPGDCMTLREDTVVPSFPREAMLQNAPRTAAGCIALPKTPGISE